MQAVSFTLIMPQLLLLGFGCLALLTDLFASKRFPKGAYTLVQLSLLVAIVWILKHLTLTATVGFDGNVVSDGLAQLLQLFIYISAFAAFLYARHYNAERQIPAGEYYVLGLFSVLGMVILVSAHSLLTVYLGLELMSLPLYAMVALRRDSLVATEAAMKYFVMGAIASGILLYGMSMLYGATGKLALDEIAQAIMAMPPEHSLILSFALVFIVVGVGFKLAAVPFHMWAPDVYTGAPTPVAAFLGSAPKLAAVGMTIRLLVQALPELQAQWHQLLMVLAILSMGVGNLFAVAQTNIKRMLAYSAIAHIGFMLLGLLTTSPAGYAASLFYILVYSLMSVGAFGMVVMLSKSEFEAENIEDFKGLNARNPWLAFLMLILMLSMAGVPPTAGFFAKFLVIQALVAHHSVWLAVLAMLFAVIGAFYYIRVIKVMYFDTPDAETAITRSADMTVALSINSLALLFLGIFPGFLYQLCLRVF